MKMIEMTTPDGTVMHIGIDGDTFAVRQAGENDKVPWISAREEMIEDEIIYIHLREDI